MKIKSYTGKIWYLNDENKRFNEQEFFKDIDNIDSYIFSVPKPILKILYSKGFTKPFQIDKLFFSDFYYTSIPFLYQDMLKSIERIKGAIKNKEKIAIFGDSDVDGILALTLLFNFLKTFGADIIYAIPSENEGYGLSNERIDYFYKNGVSLILTVDNGISAISEVQYAKEKGIDVIITDHHNPKEVLPDAYAIINPKIEKHIYFKFLSGCGVAFKLIEAYLFSTIKLFNEIFILVDLSKIEWKIKSRKDIYINIEITEIKQLTINKNFSYSVKVENSEFLKKANDIALKGGNVFKFGNVIEIEKLQEFIESYFPGKTVITDNKSLLFSFFRSINISNKVLSGLKLKEYKELYPDKYPKIGFIQFFKENYPEPHMFKYFEFFSLLRMNYKKIYKYLKQQLSYVALATIADIMPLQDENRIFVKEGLENINSRTLKQIDVMVSDVFYLEYPISSEDVIWKISPILNSPGRFGKGEILLNYFISDDYIELKQIISNVISLNRKRTETVDRIIKSFPTVHDENDILVFELTDTEHGLSGLLASRFVSMYNKPAIVIIDNKDKITGSFRSFKFLDAFDFLSKFNDYFENFGGHPSACGFTLKREKYKEFLIELKKTIKKVKVEKDIKNYFDCILNLDDINENFKKWYFMMEPFGEGFKKPIFLSYPVEITNLRYIGRENSSAKFIVKQGENEFESVFFKSKTYLQNVKLKDIKGIIYSFQKDINSGKLSLRIHDIFLEIQENKNESI